MKFNEFESSNVKLTILEDVEQNENFCEIKINRNLLNILFLSLISYTNPKPKIKEEITKQEKEILGRMAQGKSNKEIGYELFISQHTVKAHIKNIFYKLKTNDRTNAVIKAIKYNIINIYE